MPPYGSTLSLRQLPAEDTASRTLKEGESL